MLIHEEAYRFGFVVQGFAMKPVCGILPATGAALKLYPATRVLFLCGCICLPYPSSPVRTFPDCSLREYRDQARTADGRLGYWGYCKRGGVGGGGVTRLVLRTT